MSAPELTSEYRGDDHGQDAPSIDRHVEDGEEFPRLGHLWSGCLTLSGVRTG